MPKDSEKVCGNSTKTSKHDVRQFSCCVFFGRYRCRLCERLFGHGSNFHFQWDSNRAKNERKMWDIWENCVTSLKRESIVCKYKSGRQKIWCNQRTFCWIILFWPSGCLKITEKKLFSVMIAAVIDVISCANKTNWKRLHVITDNVSKIESFFGW